MAMVSPLLARALGSRLGLGLILATLLELEEDRGSRRAVPVPPGALMVIPDSVVKRTDRRTNRARSTFSVVINNSIMVRVRRIPNASCGPLCK